MLLRGKIRQLTEVRIEGVDTEGDGVRTLLSWVERRTLTLVPSSNDAATYIEDVASVCSHQCHND